VHGPRGNQTRAQGDRCNEASRGVVSSRVGPTFLVTADLHLSEELVGGPGYFIEGGRVWLESGEAGEVVAGGARQRVDVLLFESWRVEVEDSDLDPVVKMALKGCG
jgi:hypothetical protein